MGKNIWDAAHLIIIMKCLLGFLFQFSWCRWVRRLVHCFFGMQIWFYNSYFEFSWSEVRLQLNKAGNDYSRLITQLLLTSSRLLRRPGKNEKKLIQFQQTSTLKTRSDSPSDFNLSFSIQLGKSKFGGIFLGQSSEEQVLVPSGLEIFTEILISVHFIANFESE